MNITKGVGSGRQGTANAVTWILALDMGMLRFCGTLCKTHWMWTWCFAVCKRAINPSTLEISALTDWACAYSTLPDCYHIWPYDSPPVRIFGLANTIDFVKLEQLHLWGDHDNNSETCFQYVRMGTHRGEQGGTCAPPVMWKNDVICCCLTKYTKIFARVFGARNR